MCTAEKHTYIILLFIFLKLPPPLSSTKGMGASNSTCFLFDICLSLGMSSQHHRHVHERHRHEHGSLDDHQYRQLNGLPELVNNGGGSGVRSQTLHGQSMNIQPTCQSLLAQITDNPPHVHLPILSVTYPGSRLTVVMTHGLGISSLSYDLVDKMIFA